MSRPLSPTAQAVMQAITQRLYCLDPNDLPGLSAELMTTTAVIIRALADQAGSAKHWHRDQLHILAAELEAQP